MFSNAWACIVIVLVSVASALCGSRVQLLLKDMDDRHGFIIVPFSGLEAGVNTHSYPPTLNPKTPAHDVCI